MSKKKAGKKKTAKAKPPSKPAKPTKPAKKAKTAARAPGAKKPPLAISTQHVDYLTYKSSQLQKFYGEILELPTEFRDMDGVDYLLVRTSATSTLGFMPPHPDLRGEAAPREPGLYFMVDDVERAYQHLLSKGVRFTRPPEIMPWGHRVLTTTDPEGRTVMLAAEVEPED
ncbi:MAG TPA: VOC family protein [Vicinamibacteria bacterium]|jgi:predicted enzyme related to lactoylglutathione lyase